MEWAGLGQEGELAGRRGKRVGLLRLDRLGFAVFIFLSVFLFLFLFKTVLKLNLKQGEDGIKNCFANIVIYF